MEVKESLLREQEREKERKKRVGKRMLDVMKN